MPTYTYECTRTGKRFDLLQRMTDAPADACPTCGAPARRIIAGGAAFIIKGDRSRHAPVAAPDARTRCGKARTCCGKETPCEKKPCEG